MDTNVSKMFSNVGPNPIRPNPDTRYVLFAYSSDVDDRETTCYAVDVTKIPISL